MVRVVLCNGLIFSIIGPLQDPVTWYNFKYTSEQVVQWDFQNKGRCIVPMCNLLTSICNFVPCDPVVQRAFFLPMNMSQTLHSK